MKQCIIKLVKGKHDNSDAVEKVINYIYRGAKQLPLEERIYGGIGCGSNNRKDIINAFKKVKKVYRKTEGSQLKHIVVSFGKKPEVPTEVIRKKIKKIVGFFVNGKMPEGNFLVAYGVHYNKEDNYHLHICVNSISNRGKCLNLKGKVLNEFRNHVNRTWEKILLT